MTPRWIPGDHELDAVARGLDVDEPRADRGEHNRTAILAAAATRKQQSRRSAAPFIAAGIALAAAATVALWLGLRPAQPTSHPIAEAPKQLITPLGAARFERVTDWPDYLVRVDHGKIAVQVAKLAANERFRVKTANAEVEVRGTRFDVGVETGRLMAVAVHEGRVEIRGADQQVVILSAGESWAPVQAAQRDELELPAHTPAPPPPGDHASTGPAPPTAPATTIASASSPNPPGPSSRSTRSSSEPAHPVDHRPPSGASVASPTPASEAHDAAAPHASPTGLASPSKPAAQPNRASSEPANHLDNQPPAGSRTPAPISPPPAAPGEAEFRAGWAALRAGDPAAAATAFATACKTIQSDAIGEDACFWAGAAAKRAGDTATARAALSQFVQRFPTSSRAAEASALLGWLLYDAGELDAAEKLFQNAEHDRVPKVRDSATRGLTAIDHKRHGTR